MNVRTTPVRNTLLGMLLVIVAGCAADEDAEDLPVASSSDELDATQAAVAGCSVEVVPSRELMIRDVGVVDDPVRTGPGGAWSFGVLMGRMAGDGDAELFVRRWLAKLENDQTVNGDLIPGRPKIREALIAPWPRTTDGKLILGRAPFRLLAIVNRIDKRRISSGHAGEGQFIFGAIDANGEPLPFTVNLEYKMPAANESVLEDWARRWHALGKLTPGTSDFNRELQKITDRFTGRGAWPGHPNGSAISQVRTNDGAFGTPNQMREFQLGDGGQLVAQTLPVTPAAKFRAATRTATFINANASAIVSGSYSVPLTLDGAPFLGAEALTNGSTIWNPPGVKNNDARFKFSINTCNGCHGGETGSAFHIVPRRHGWAAVASGFIKGTTVKDRVTGESRAFADLARRRRGLTELLCSF